MQRHANSTGKNGCGEREPPTAGAATAHRTLKVTHPPFLSKSLYYTPVVRIVRVGRAVIFARPLFFPYLNRRPPIITRTALIVQIAPLHLAIVLAVPL